MLILLFIWISGMVLARKKSNAALYNASISTNDSTQNDLPNELVPNHTVAHLIDSISKSLHCKIRIKEAKINTTLNVRPAFWSIFGKPDKREYIIRVNNNPKFTGIYNHEVPLQARTGLWFHELMHIKDYQSRSTFGILSRGVQYLTIKGRKLYEHEIDRMVVTAGYGDALYEWAKFIMYDSDASDTYKSYKRTVYLTPIQIESEMRGNTYMVNH